MVKYMHILTGRALELPAYGEKLVLTIQLVGDTPSMRAYMQGYCMPGLQQMWYQKCNFKTPPSLLLSKIWSTTLSALIALGK